MIDKLRELLHLHRQRKRVNISSYIIRKVRSKLEQHFIHPLTDILLLLHNRLVDRQPSQDNRCGFLIEPINQLLEAFTELSFYRCDPASQLSFVLVDCLELDMVDLAGGFVLGGALVDQAEGFVAVEGADVPAVGAALAVLGLRELNSFGLFVEGVALPEHSVD